MDKKIFDELIGSSGKNSMDIKRYFKLLWHRKYLILSITALITVVWVILYSYYLPKFSNYSTTAIIRFDDPKSSNPADPVTDYTKLGAASKIAILNTSNLLGRVVDSLRLNLIMVEPEISHYILFKDAQISPEAKFGKYQIQFINNSIKLQFSNEEEGEKTSKIINDWNPQSTEPLLLEFMGITLTIKPNIWKNYSEVIFEHIPRRFAINNLRSRMETELDKSQTILRISYSSAKPDMAARVTNTISGVFIDQLLEYKRFQTGSVLNLLEKQLVSAREKLKKSEEELKKFREDNPFVILSSETEQIVSDMAIYEKEKTDYEQSILDIRELLEKKNEQTDFESIVLIHKEILSFLVEQKVLGASVLAQQYDQVIGERQRLLQQWSSQHPDVVDIEKQIKDLHANINNRATQYLQQLEQNIKSNQRKITSIRSDLYALPEKELRFAQLKRDQQINEQIASSIMVKYNETKVADAAIVPDAYIIDEAEPPIVYSGLIDYLKKYGIGILLGLVLGNSVILGYDYFDPAVKDQNHVEQVLKLPVLSTIPIIGSDKKVPDPEELKRKIDPKLITGDYSPTIEGEAFRILRTKLALGNLKENNSLIITSLNPGEGKSLIASNLAITFAQQKFSTLLIDCDLRRGVLHKSFACKKKPGLTDLLFSNKELDLDVISKSIQKTHIPNLFLIPFGTPVPNPSELLGSDKMKQIYQILKNKFGILIIDTAPIQFTPDAFIINSLVHNVVLVVKYGKTNLNKLYSKVKEFGHVKQDISGVVINGYKDITSKNYYYSYYQY